MITFKILKQDKNKKARVGEIHTPHGIIETPIFVPVGTQATVKSLTPDDLQQIGVQIFFGNTYHLHLRPGEDTIEKLGGLAKFQNWKGATITDSGGFQVFSLANLSQSRVSSSKTGISKEDEVTLENSSNSKLGKSNEQIPQQLESPKLVKITEDGVLFKSHLDGTQHMFSPEQSIAIQKKIGADIVLSLDQCSTYPIAYDEAKANMERTHRWAVRSLSSFQKPGPFSQALYGIVQGSVFRDLRKKSAQFISALNFDGIAIGGVSVGESKSEMVNALDWTTPFLPDNKPRHLLGVGDVDDIFEVIGRGVDTFDCVTPSRLGRVGIIFTHPPTGSPTNRFRYDINKALYSQSNNPLDTECDCYVCQNYTQGYIHHLFRAHELLAYRLATYHNIFFLIHLSKQIRQALLDDKFEKMKKEWLG